MSTHSAATPKIGRPHEESRVLRLCAWASLVVGLIAVAASGMLGLTLLANTPVALALRDALGMSALSAAPIGMIGLTVGTVGLTSTRKIPAIIGVVLSSLALVAFVVSIALGG